MALSFTEGSIGGDIERIDLDELQAFLRQASAKPSRSGASRDTEPRGSNGIAIAPKLTSDGKALLLINPHTSFYFRSELQMSSDEGLDAYGAATWGQFFIYQGFNPHAGWMHTSSGVDNVDEFAVPDRAARQGLLLLVRHDCRPLGMRPVTIRYRTATGRLATRSFTDVDDPPRPDRPRREGKRWIAFAMMNKPVEALQQSFLRTKATDLQSFMRISDLKANSSNNTVFADDKGEIAVLAPQFMPRRDNRFDYTKPVDGSDPATDWHGLHAVAELPNTINPRDRLGFNSNDWLYSAAGPRQPEARAITPPISTWPARAIARIHATRLLTQPGRWSLDRLQTAAYDSAPAVVRGAGADAGRGLAGACRRTIRAERASPSRSRRSRAGTSAGRVDRCRTRSPISGATSSRSWSSAPRTGRPSQHVPPHGSG